MLAGMFHERTASCSTSTATFFCRASVAHFIKQRYTHWVTSRNTPHPSAAASYGTLLKLTAFVLLTGWGTGICTYCNLPHSLLFLTLRDIWNLSEDRLSNLTTRRHILHYISIIWLLKTYYLNVVPVKWLIHNHP
jgi:hypothetical protein